MERKTGPSSTKLLTLLELCVSCTPQSCKFWVCFGFFFFLLFFLIFAFGFFLPGGRVEKQSQVASEINCEVTWSTAAANPPQVHHLSLPKWTMPGFPEWKPLILESLSPTCSVLTSRLKSMLKSGMQTCLSSIFLRMFLMAWMEVS